MINKIEEELSNIKHFKLHPELLPFIGSNYNVFKILIMGESHYIGKHYKDSCFSLDSWYCKETCSYAWEKDNDSEWFNTRGVLNSFLSGYKARAYSMFRKPSEVLKESIEKKCRISVTDEDAFESFAFFNFFQRPEIHMGKSISDTSDDQQKAVEIFNDIIRVIQPNKIIFLSKKAYEVFTGSESSLLVEDKIEYVMHPTCRHWSEDSGEKKFRGIVDDYLIREKNNNIRNGILKMIEVKDILIQKIFKYVEEELKKFNCFEFSTPNIECSFKEDSTCERALIAIFNTDGTQLALKFSIINDNIIWFGICALDDKNSADRRRLVHRKLTPKDTVKKRKGKWFWYRTFAILPNSINRSLSLENAFKDKRDFEIKMNIYLELLNEVIGLIVSSKQI